MAIASGWVTARFASSDRPPVGILCDWTDESYALVAPKKLVAQHAVARRANRSPGGPR